MEISNICITIFSTLFLLKISNKPRIQRCVNNMGMNSIALCGKIVKSSRTMLTNVYNYNIYIKSITDICLHSGKLLISLVLDHQVEPLYQNWISVSSNTKLDTTVNYNGILNISLLTQVMCYNYNDIILKYRLNEDYALTSNPINLRDIDDYEETICKYEPENLVVYKRDDKYVYRIYNNGISIQAITIDNMSCLIKCPQCLLSIEYTHPLMNSGINIQITKNEYYTNNEILSPTFIHRYLHYQSSSFIFDYDYVLNIIDNNINVFTLTSNQYIKLTHDNYDIMNIKSEQNDSNDKLDTINELSNECDDDVPPLELVNPSELISDDIDYKSDSDDEYINIKEPDRIISFLYKMFA